MHIISAIALNYVTEEILQVQVKIQKESKGKLLKTPSLYMQLPFLRIKSISSRNLFKCECSDRKWRTFACGLSTKQHIIRRTAIVTVTMLSATHWLAARVMSTSNGVSATEIADLNEKLDQMTFYSRFGKTSSIKQDKRCSY